MCPDEDDVLEKTAAKSNPGNSRGVASMNSFVARAPTNQSPPEHFWERHPGRPDTPHHIPSPKLQVQPKPEHLGRV